MYEPLQLDPSALADSINYTWILVVSFLIFFMHAGFAMLEAGQVRSKNVANQLTKNMLTWSVGVIVFFLIGATVEAVVAGVTGGGSYSLFAIFSPESTLSWVSWLFGAVFACRPAYCSVAARCGETRPTPARRSSFGPPSARTFPRLDRAARPAYAIWQRSCRRKPGQGR